MSQVERPGSYARWGDGGHDYADHNCLLLLLIQQILDTAEGY